MEYTQEHREILWKTGYNDFISLEDMESSHLQNAIICLAKKQAECENLSLGEYHVNGRDSSEWIQLFRSELHWRIAESAEKSPTMKLTKITI